ncbi:histone lysine methyltransferase Set7 [Schizosaccharomyces cryophilus OY26]|uniref:Histone lysine methyltransferase Set7 n=1 Tax=Schizosaccharomyces cryophilus (strain OY26 / ATCC MYA-4695 / CBS 11777 / NBRC 106824 / NRRL Y48691) TaxID=653667 RepID=S9VWU6_SCHCR|nr:histone lysine methyltransferase Set7 [Schizosaccharomyces cryophilus OY26]EPY52128.1 histone lysine methyltransferase Set7 [Schizosaccharomyces cryophilus OY26]
MKTISLFDRPLEIRDTETKGRGVFALEHLPAHTCIEISPVLLFQKEQYENHGQYTVLNEYTYVWSAGRQGLALGLGSMFNHDRCPNVYWKKDEPNRCISYFTLRQVHPNEELCISYGDQLWFDDGSASSHNHYDQPEEENSFLQNLLL